MKTIGKVASVILLVLVIVILTNIPWASEQQTKDCRARGGTVVSEKFYYSTDWVYQETGRVDYCKLPQNTIGEVYNEVITGPERMFLCVVDGSAVKILS